MRTHELARRLLAGPDLPAVVALFDDQDRDRYLEVRICESLPYRYRWYDTNSQPRREPAVELSTADE